MKVLDFIFTMTFSKSLKIRSFSLNFSLFTKKIENFGYLINFRLWFEAFRLKK